MPFIEKQKHGDHTYYYAVKSVRVSAKTVKRFRIFLGRTLPREDDLKVHFAELEKRALSSYKTMWLPKDLVEKVDDISATATTFYKTKSEILPKDFLVRYTYNTNAIEGNKLTLRQTALVANDRIAPEGARADDVIEVINGIDAWSYVKSYKGRLSKAFVCQLQYQVTKNTSCMTQGSYRETEVRIAGSSHTPPKAEVVPELLEKLFKEFYQKKKSLHPVELATVLHNKFVGIHPFTDGNGRTARLLMNWVLLSNKFPPVIVEVSNKEQYYNAIEAADKGDQMPFAVFLAKQMSLQYTRLLPSQL